MKLFEVILIVIVLLLIFGPSKLPQLGKSLGDTFRGFKKGLNEDPEKPARRLPNDEEKNPNAHNDNW